MSLQQSSTESLTTHACEECQSPLEVGQRYCVVCGTRNRNASNPAAEYFSSAGRPRRVPIRPAPEKKGWAGGIWPLVLLAIVPVAVAIGVLVGKSGGGTDESKLLEALRSGTPVAAAPAQGQTTTASVASVSSDYSLSKGYTVKLATAGSAAGVRAAEKAARSKGASAVGVIAVADFDLKPAQSATYVIYSGQFKTKAAAQKALGRLKKSFPHAQVIKVGAKGSGATSGKALSTTQFGTAHQVAGSKPSGAEVQRDTNLVKDLSKKTGKSYVQQQTNLPDKVTIGGGGGGGNAPSGAGD